MVNNIESSNKVFNLTEVFTSIKSKNSWTDDETKTFLLFLEGFSTYTQFVKPKSTEKLVSIKPSNTVKIPMKRFNEITSFGRKSKSTGAYYKELKKLQESLVQKSISMPHPLSKVKSFIVRALFITASYNADEDVLSLSLHDDLVERFEFYTKYIKNFDVNKVGESENDPTIRTYIYISGLIDIYNLNQVRISIKEYKEILTLNNKYKQISAFKKYILEPVKNELKNEFDIEFDFKLEKVGRAYSDITFTFSYLNKQSVIETSKNNVNSDVDHHNNIENEFEESIFEAILTSWGIRAKKVVEIEENYSLNTINSAIEITKKAIDNKQVKSTSAAFFIGTLQNKELQENIKIETEKKKAEVKFKREQKEKKDKDYDKICSFIFSNENAISAAITTHTKCLPITDHEVKSVFEEIKKIDADKYRDYITEVISFYHFEVGKTTPLSLSEIVDWGNMIKINSYKNDLEIIESYKEAYEEIKRLDYFSDEQKSQLKKEVQDSINILLGF